MSIKKQKTVPAYDGNLRNHMIKIPICISECSGIRVFGRRIKSLVFTTDVAIIKNINADAVISVYPFSPQTIITHSIIMAADMPVFAGVGGGVTRGQRVVNLATDAEAQGALGIVVNAPTENEIITQVKRAVDIPVVVTVVSEYTDIQSRLDAGADFINVSGASKTPAIVRKIRENFPDVPIIATGGPSDDTILETIRAGANAITYTPPTSGELFAISMDKYRHQAEQQIT